MGMTAGLSQAQMGTKPGLGQAEMGMTADLSQAQMGTKPGLGQA